MHFCLLNSPIYIYYTKMMWYLYLLQLMHSHQDGHEICYVGDEAFRELSQVDPKADSLLDEVTF